MNKRWKATITWQDINFKTIDRQVLPLEEFRELDAYVERHIDWNDAPFVTISLEYNHRNGRR